MAIVQKSLEEHVTEALANFLDQFRGKPILDKFMEIYVRQVEDAERVAFELLNDRALDTAVGAQLDGIGSIIGETRQGRNDADYRIGLATRIDLNLSNGTREDIIKIILGVVGSGSTIEITEYYPAGFVAQVLTNVAPGFDPTPLGNFVRSAKAAGVRGTVEYSVNGAYQYDSGPGLDLGYFGGAS